MSLKSLKEKKPHMAAKVVGTDTVLVPLKENVAELSEMFTLNEVGSFIWEQLDHTETLDGLANAVVAEFDVEPETAKADVTAFVAELEAFIASN